MDKVVVLWTTNNEWYSDIFIGLSDAMYNVLASFGKNGAKISP
jgi:hypothetical protein